MVRELRCLAACACAALVLPAAASNPTLDECFEGSDFIANAARARENGIARDEFIARMQTDFELIKAYPPEMRWFAKDAEDERFLLDSARDVFDAPQAPERHRVRFLEACLGRVAI